MDTSSQLVSEFFKEIDMNVLRKTILDRQKIKNQLVPLENAKRKILKSLEDEEIHIQINILEQRVDFSFTKEKMQGYEVLKSECSKMVSMRQIIYGLLRLLKSSAGNPYKEAILYRILNSRLEYLVSSYSKQNIQCLFNLAADFNCCEMFFEKYFENILDIQYSEVIPILLNVILECNNINFYDRSNEGCNIIYNQLKKEGYAVDEKKLPEIIRETMTNILKDVGILVANIKFIKKLFSNLTYCLFLTNSLSSILPVKDNTHQSPNLCYSSKCNNNFRSTPPILLDMTINYSCKEPLDLSSCSTPPILSPIVTTYNYKELLNLPVSTKMDIDIPVEDFVCSNLKK